jgi:hypothetical protein
MYPAGYEIDRTILGSRYVRPATKTNQIVSFNHGYVTFAGGNLSAGLMDEVLIDANNKVTVVGNDRFTLNLISASGLFTGRGTDPSTGKAIPFKGALLQKRAAGFGQFLGTNQTGQVLFNP